MSSSYTMVLTNGKVTFPRPRNFISSVPDPTPTVTAVDALPNGVVLDDHSGDYGIGMLYGTPSDTVGTYGPITVSSVANGVTQDCELTIDLRNPITIATSVPVTHGIYYYSSSDVPAAQFLADCLNLMIGIPGRFTITSGGAFADDSLHGFYVGAFPFTGYELPDGPDVFKGAPNPNRYVIKTVGSFNYCLRGASTRATYAACATFLEEYFPGFAFMETLVTLTGDHLFSPGVAGLVATELPAAAPVSLPLTCAQLEERLFWSYAIETRKSVEAQTDDYINKGHGSKIDPEYQLTRDYWGGGQHQPCTLLQLPAGSGGHATQGAYWKLAGGTGVQVSNPGSSGISGVGIVDEDVRFKRSGVTYKTAKLTWPCRGDDWGVFLHSPDNSDVVMTGDTLQGVTSGFTCTVTGPWLTDLRPDWVLPNKIGGDPYDLSLRYTAQNDDGVLSAQHLCYSSGNDASGGGSLGLVMATCVYNNWSTITEDDRNNRLAALGNTQDGSGGQCLCDRCAAAYVAAQWTDDYGILHSPESDPMIVMGKQWITKQRSFSGFGSTWINLMAYESPVYEAPTTACIDGMSVLVIHIGGCIYHPWIGDSCPTGRQYDVNLRRWVDICSAGMLTLWDYSQFFGANSLKPMPMNGIFYTVRRLQEMGARSYIAQGQNVVGGDRSVMKWKIFHFLLTHPWYTVDFAVRWYADIYYGAASDMVVDAWNMIEDHANNSGGYPTVHGHIFDLLTHNYASGLYSIDLRDDMSALYTAALAAVAGNSEKIRRVKEFFALQVASIGCCIPDGSYLGATGTITIGAHPTDPGTYPNVFFRDTGDGPRYTYDVMKDGADNCRWTSPSEFSNGGEAFADLPSHNLGVCKIISRDDIDLYVPVNHSACRLWWLKVQGQTVIPFPTLADRYIKTTVTRGLNPSGLTYWGADTPSSVTYWEFAGGSRCNSGQGGGDNGGDLLSETSTSCESVTYVGMGASSGPNPDGKHFQQVSVAAKSGGSQVITINYYFQLQGDSDANPSNYPEIVTSYPGACTLVSDNISKFTVTGIPGLTGVTVTDNCTVHVPVVDSMYAETDPYTTTSRKKSTICFGLVTATTTKTLWCTRVITVSGI